MLHSLVEWPFANFGHKWDLPTMCRIAQNLGCHSIELVDPVHWPILKEHGLLCAIAPVDPVVPGEPPFARGFNNPAHRAEVIRNTRQAIDACAASGFPNVITFTGYHFHDPGNPSAGVFSLQEGAEACIAAYREIIPYAQDKNVTLCLEMLNTRDASSPDHGHPGYQGDHIDYCAEIVRAVGSPYLKLLFDFYHVQIMDGDLIRHLHQHADILGHIHTAGVPGRHEIGDSQEINYPAVIRALQETGYKGYIGHEFMPTADPLTALREALTLCTP